MNDKLKTAEILGIGKSTLYRKLKGYGFGRVTPEKREKAETISESADQLNQLAILKKEAESVFHRMREFERRLRGRRA